mmetsp:Transcript_28465/g.43481  ORF Transcript_28465/g.43481 Transcript_28465/m.43481 type:complete len:88 (+) Transcript_28465:1277-1540(+)
MNQVFDVFSSSNTLEIKNIDSDLAVAAKLSKNFPTLFLSLSLYLSIYYRECMYESRTTRAIVCASLTKSGLKKNCCTKSFNLNPPLS